MGNKSEGQTHEDLYYPLGSIFGHNDLSPERRYLLKEFPELASCGECSTVLEVGCGNGSTALPILRKEALERAKENIEAANIDLAKERFYPFQCDFSASGFPNWLVCTSCSESFFQKQNMCSSDTRSCSKQDFPDPPGSAKNNSYIAGVDFVTLIFTLSAVPLQRMSRAITECFSVLKPGGLLLFRDYGLYDMTMLRFEPEQRVGYREYMRSDGTRSYFFCLDSVRDLFCGTGFTELELEYCCVQSVNRRNGKIMRRVWIHGKFQKPHVDSWEVPEATCHFVILSLGCFKVSLHYDGAAWFEKILKGELLLFLWNRI
ncbi:hypothetical protein HAX54_025334 [Datura stramonium]|uniref:Methyltransferase-like protein n=1 Tax=Datura stramonium TaxID=4076 RepID=A0ABS8V0H9_DATST|nr:hypothetical protein [Datura stramonium]